MMNTSDTFQSTVPSRRGAGVLSAGMRRFGQSTTVGMKMAFVEMHSHKLRSSLSVLGVMLGVASLVAMLTLIGGIDVFLHKRMSKWAGSIWFWRTEAPDESEKLAWSRSPGMRFSDGTHMEENVDEAEHYYRIIERQGDIVMRGKQEHVHVRGMDGRTVVDELEQVEIRRGRMLSEKEFTKGEPVCLLSWEMDERLKKQLGAAGADSALFLGEQCRFRNLQLRVVGIFWPRDENFRPWGLRRTVIVPIRTMQKFLTGLDPDPGSIRLSVRDPDRIQEQAARIARELAVRHRGVEDFEYRTADWLEDITRMLNNATILMSIVSVISLLVGGMSIMNVMLSSIAERIHEIGVRKALGAKNLQIFVQFLAESITLCFTGGCAGALLGLIPIAFSDAIQRSTDGAIEPTILPQHVAFVFAIIAVVGIVFGLYPALRAVKMDPVEALRYE
jgi:putative ABC transport system permease protein